MVRIYIPNQTTVRQLPAGPSIRVRADVSTNAKRVEGGFEYTVGMTAPKARYFVAAKDVIVVDDEPVKSE